MTPANLHDAVREAYARGKESDDSATIEQAIAWGRVAFDMTMTDVVREEILSTVARAQIRVGKWKDADETIAFMQARSEEHTSELQSLMRISYAVFCLKKKKQTTGQSK